MAQEVTNGTGRGEGVFNAWTGQEGQGTQEGAGQRPAASSSLGSRLGSLGCAHCGRVHLPPLSLLPLYGPFAVPSTTFSSLRCTLGMKLHLLPVLNPAPPRPRKPLALTWPHSHSGPLAIRSAVRCQSPRFRAPSMKGSCLQGRSKNACKGRACGGQGRYPRASGCAPVERPGVLPVTRGGARIAPPLLLLESLQALTTLITSRISVPQLGLRTSSHRPAIEVAINSVRVAEAPRSLQGGVASPPCVLGSRQAQAPHLPEHARLLTPWPPRR